MGKSKGSSIELPAPPSAQQFSLPGFGTTNFANNIWGFSEDPTQQAYRQQLETMRASILKGLGITAPEREASLNQWQDIFTKEALRTSMPQLEQTLFSRGMGGSKLYQDAITDLLSKVATQGVLNREQLSQADEALKLNQLASILGAGQTNLSNMSGMLGGAVDQTNQVWNQWYQMLPYLAKVKAGSSSPWGTIGSLAGAGLGALFALPTGGMSVPMGAALGSSLGGGVGGMIGGSPSQLDLSWLAMLGGSPQTANVAGLGRVPIAPANYYKSALGVF